MAPYYGDGPISVAFDFGTTASGIESILPVIVSQG